MGKLHLTVLLLAVIAVTIGVYGVEGGRPVHHLLNGILPARIHLAWRLPAT